MNVIQKMLRDYYEIIEYDLRPRPVIMENIEKVINCGDPSFGGACMDVPIAATLNLSLSAATLSSVLPVALNIPMTGLLPCPLN